MVTWNQWYVIRRIIGLFNILVKFYNIVHQSTLQNSITNVLLIFSFWSKEPLSKTCKKIKTFKSPILYDNLFSYNNECTFVSFFFCVGNFNIVCSYAVSWRVINKIWVLVYLKYFFNRLFLTEIQVFFIKNNSILIYFSFCVSKLRHHPVV